ncbi:MAG: hypothetical protein ACFCUL_03455 [Flavobacteriaceae bacterium]
MPPIPNSAASGLTAIPTPSEPHARAKHFSVAFRRDPTSASPRPLMVADPHGGTPKVMHLPLPLRFLT